MTCRAARWTQPSKLTEPYSAMLDMRCSNSHVCAVQGDLDMHHDYLSI
jgi:hypothetical protein